MLKRKELEKENHTFQLKKKIERENTETAHKNFSAKLQFTFLLKNGIFDCFV